MLDEAYSTSVHESSQIKNIIWVGSSRTDLKTFPAEVMAVMGYALYQAQLGRKAPSAKPLHGFGGAGILEIVRDHHTDAYRAVYTVKFSEFVYVLHAFQKKSRKGIATPKPDIDRRNIRNESKSQIHQDKKTESEPREDRAQ